MKPDPDLPLRPENVTWQQLREGAEASWPLEGPNSQGGTTLYRYRGQLFVVGYGEHSRLPGGAEQVLSTRPDNSPGFPPAVEGGHAAGCRHDDWRGVVWWQHGTCLLEVGNGSVHLLERGELLWTCTTESFTRVDSPRRADLLLRLGPAVLDEALRCVARGPAG